MIWAIIIGIVAGWLAGKIMKGSGFGLLGDLILGILGSIIGPILLDAIGLRTTGSTVGQILVSTFGAVVLLFLIRLIHSKP